MKFPNMVSKLHGVDLVIDGPNDFILVVVARHVVKQGLTSIHRIIFKKSKPNMQRTKLELIKT